ncbi:MAG: hypothetical protein V1676_03390 [Candidatus Diapherotrites archaeon]
MAWFGFRKKGTLGKRHEGEALRRMHGALSNMGADKGENMGRRIEAWNKKHEIKAALSGARGANTDSMLHDYMDYTARSALEETRRALEGIKGSIPEGRNPRRIEFEHKMDAVEEMLEKPEGSTWTKGALDALGEYVGFQDKKWLFKDRHKIAVLRAFIEREGAAAEKAAEKLAEEKRKDAAPMKRKIPEKEAREAAKNALIEIRRQLMVKEGTAPFGNIRTLTQAIKSGKLNAVSASFLRLHIARLEKMNRQNPEIEALREFLRKESRVPEQRSKPGHGEPAQTGREYAVALLEKAIKGTGSMNFMKELVEAADGSSWGPRAKNIVHMRITELKRNAPKSRELAELKKFVKGRDFSASEQRAPDAPKAKKQGPLSKFFSGKVLRRPLPKEITGALVRMGHEPPKGGNLDESAVKVIKLEYNFLVNELAKNNVALAKTSDKEKAGMLLKKNNDIRRELEIIGPFAKVNARRR